MLGPWNERGYDEFCKQDKHQRIAILLTEFPADSSLSTRMVGRHTFESNSVPVVAVAIFFVAGPATWDSPASDSDLLRFDADEDWTIVGCSSLSSISALVLISRPPETRVMVMVRVRSANAWHGGAVHSYRRGQSGA